MERWRRSALVVGPAVLAVAFAAIAIARNGNGDGGSTVQAGSPVAAEDPLETATTTAVTTTSTAPAPAATAAPRKPLATVPPAPPTTSTTEVPVVDDCHVLVQRSWPPLGPDEAFVHRAMGPIAKIDVVTGEVGPALMRDMGIMRLSVDGSTIYYRPRNYSESCSGTVYAMPATGGSSRKVLDLSKTRQYLNSRVGVTRDDRFVLYNGGIIEIATGQERPAPELTACVPLYWTQGDTHVVCAHNGSGPLHLFDAANGFTDAPIDPPDGWAYTAVTVSRSGLVVAARQLVARPALSTVIVVITDGGKEGEVLGTIEGYSGEYLSVDASGRRVLVGGNTSNVQSTLVLVEAGKPNRVLGQPGQFSSAVW